MVGSAAVIAAACASLAPSALAITSDYCGYSRPAGDPFCFEGSGYRGWRYHQASTGSGGPLVIICVRAYSNQGYYRVNACSDSPANFISRQYCNADPASNSSVGFAGTGSVVLYGHADSRLCSSAATSSSQLPAYVADSLAEPSTAAATGVSSNTAQSVAAMGGQRVFTLAGETQRCVLSVTDDGYASACTTADALAAAGGQQLVVDEHDGEYRVFGLVGGTKATVTMADGARTAIPVSGAGATAASFKSRPVSVTVQSARGSTSTSLPAA